MEPILALLVGVLLSGAVYLMLGRNLVKFLIGLMLLSNAANLTIFSAGRLTWAAPPLVPMDATEPAGQVANALPQALILTAIVISFGLVAFAMVLAYRAYQEIGTVDTDAMRLAEPKEEKEPAAEPETPARERDAA
jgi:multicomponent Na+:H+ antiporter subunit C